MEHIHTRTHLGPTETLHQNVLWKYGWNMEPARFTSLILYNSQHSARYKPCRRSCSYVIAVVWRSYTASAPASRHRMLQIYAKTIFGRRGFSSARYQPIGGRGFCPIMYGHTRYTRRSMQLPEHTMMMGSFHSRRTGYHMRRQFVVMWSSCRCPPWNRDCPRETTFKH